MLFYVVSSNQKKKKSITNEVPSLPVYSHSPFPRGDLCEFSMCLMWHSISAVSF